MTAATNDQRENLTLFRGCPPELEKQILEHLDPQQQRAVKRVNKMTALLINSIAPLNQRANVILNSPLLTGLISYANYCFSYEEINEIFRSRHVVSLGRVDVFTSVDGMKIELNEKPQTSKNREYSININDINTPFFKALTEDDDSFFKRNIFINHICTDNINSRCSSKNSFFSYKLSPVTTQKITGTCCTSDETQGSFRVVTHDIIRLKKSIEFRIGNAVVTKDGVMVIVSGARIKPLYASYKLKSSDPIIEQEIIGLMKALRISNKESNCYIL